MSRKNRWIAIIVTVLIVLGGVALVFLLPSSVNRSSPADMGANPGLTEEPDELIPTDEELEKMPAGDLLGEEDEDLPPPTLDPDQEKQSPFGAEPSPSPTP